MSDIREWSFAIAEIIDKLRAIINTMSEKDTSVTKKLVRIRTAAEGALAYAELMRQSYEEEE